MTNYLLKSVYQDTMTLASLVPSARVPEFRSGDPESWCERGKELASLGHYSEALASYNQAIAISPDNHKAWMLRGGALTHLDRYEDALSSFERALEIKPHDPAASLFRGVALHQLGHYKNAYASYNQILGNGRRSIWQKLINLLGL
ncbi:tetratricopeptide repeat protein [Lyngbya aestuarii]|uniref:tetratricopeptide repeat protein n=1 Tax=Lyngbya aestuarii TaxID=118322 RepID=UPI00403DC402